MNLRLSKNQEEVLNFLLDKYENSATYKGDNLRKQSFSINPEKVFPEYNEDYTDQDEVDNFNSEMNILMKMQYVNLKYIKGTSVISKITLNTSMIEKIYQVLKRRDISKKREKEIEMYRQFLNINPLIDAFCNEQISRLSNYKNAKYTLDIARNVLKLLTKVLGNKQDIMERELSIAILGNTKLFEKSYKSRICSIIEEYGNFGEDLTILDKKQKEKVILEEYQVFSNPSYIYLKGYVDIYYINGIVIKITPDNPIAISSESIMQIDYIQVKSNRIITVENLTSYNRVYDTKTTFIYISGYHNTAKQKFVKKMVDGNDVRFWGHFGDIDPDGYFILKNLKDKIGINIEPIYMNVEQLIKYRKYCKPLENNDVVKAMSLLKINFYSEVMEYMLENNCKLEQEIISWLEDI